MDPRDTQTPGGIVHTYQRYDPVNFPSPTAPPPDMVSPMMEHVLNFGDTDEFTEEQLANAIHLDASQIAGLGPSIDALKEMLRERKRKILETYETKAAQKAAEKAFRDVAQKVTPPKKLANDFRKAVKEEQIADLESLYFRAGDDNSPFAQGARPARRAARRQVSGGRTRGEVRVHRPREDGRAQGARSEGGTGNDRPLAEAAGGGEEDRAARDHRHGRASEVRRTGRHGKARGAPAAGRRLHQGAGREAGTGSGRGRQVPAHAEGATAVPVEGADANLQRHAGVANRPAPGRGHRRGRGRVGQDQALRVRRQRLADGHPREHGQRAAPRRAGAAGAHEAGRHPDSPHARQPEGRDVRAARHERVHALRRPVRERQAHGPRSGRTDPQRVPRRLPPVHRDVHVREAAAPVRDRGSDAQAGDDLQPRRAAQGRHERPEHQRDADSATLHQHPARAPNRRGGSSRTRTRRTARWCSSRTACRRRTSRAVRCSCCTRRTRAPRTRPCARRCCAPATASRINIFLLATWNQSQEDVQFAYKMAQATKGRVVFTAGRDLDRYVIWDYIKRRKQIVSG